MIRTLSYVLSLLVFIEIQSFLVIQIHTSISRGLVMKPEKKETISEKEVTPICSPNISNFIMDKFVPRFLTQNLNYKKL